MADSCCLPTEGKVVRVRPQCLGVVAHALCCMCTVGYVGSVGFCQFDSRRVAKGAACTGGFLMPTSLCCLHQSTHAAGMFD